MVTVRVTVKDGGVVTVRDGGVATVRDGGVATMGGVVATYKGF